MAGFGDCGRVLEEFDVPMLPGEGVSEADDIDFFSDTFSTEKLGLSWNALYNPAPVLWKSGNGQLTLWGNERKLEDADRIAWLGRRQQHHVSTTNVTLTFECVQEGEEAIFYHIYE